jgi:hypothetical protein
MSNDEARRNDEARIQRSCSCSCLDPNRGRRPAARNRKSALRNLKIGSEDGGPAVAKAIARQAQKTLTGSGDFQSLALLATPNLDEGGSEVERVADSKTGGMRSVASHKFAPHSARQFELRHLVILSSFDIRHSSLFSPWHLAA